MTDAWDRWVLTFAAGAALWLLWRLCQIAEAIRFMLYKKLERDGFFEPPIR